MAERRAIPVYLSLEEAAEAMSVSVKTIRRWIAAGTAPDSLRAVVTVRNRGCPAIPTTRTTRGR